jgi:nucleotide-binding universal stress UspA family protein
MVEDSMTSEARTPRNLKRQTSIARSRRILVAVDGSQHALHAVQYIARHWVPSTLKVNLLYVVPAAPEVFLDLEAQVYFRQTFKGKYAQWRRDMKGVAQGFLDRARRILVEANVPENQVGLILQEQEIGIARDIVAEAKRGYDAVVIGRRGLSKGEGEIFLGSVCTKIISAVRDVPVWVVGGRIEASKLLLAVDASENSHKAVHYLGSFAKHTSAEITLYHVVRQIGLTYATNLIPRNEQREQKWLTKITRDTESMLSEYAERLEKAGVSPSRIDTKYTLESSSRSADILKEARAGDYGTVVLGRRGLSRVRQFIIGRVTSKVLSQADGLAVWLVP